MKGIKPQSRAVRLFSRDVDRESESYLASIQDGVDHQKETGVVWCFAVLLLLLEAYSWNLRFHEKGKMPNLRAPVQMARGTRGCSGSALLRGDSLGPSAWIYDLRL